MMNRRAFTAGFCGCLAGGLMGCQTHTSGPSTGLADLPAGYAPKVESDEAGLWLAVQKIEASMKTSTKRIRDPAINGLVGDIVARLTPSHAPDLRHCVMRIPHFNASCYPNGFIDVWSGLLLRCRTESELAAVMGHEISHYVRQHSVARMRDIRTKADTLAVFNAMTALAGIPAGVNDLSTLLALYSISAFSRDHEREADIRGLEMLANAGYDPMGAANIWKRLMDIYATTGEKEPEVNIFLSSHPADKEREHYLREMADKLPKVSKPPPDRLRQALIPVRDMILADEVNQGTFKRTSRLLDELMPGDPAPGQLLFARGNLHRKRGEEEDEAIALGFYHEACEANGAPIEAFRQVGVMRWRRGEKEQAREYFRRYLKLAPNAGDRKMIESYLGAA